MTLVLAADDNPDILDLVQLKLGMLGLDVTTVPDGTAAWDALQTTAYDLVILDIGMPGMNGLEVTEAVRASPQTRHLPVVLMSALATHEDVSRGLQAGADDYVTKPFSLRDLGERVQQLLGRGR